MDTYSIWLEPPYASCYGGIAECAIADGVLEIRLTTDARFGRNQAGIPAVVCGPGNVEQAHVNDEWVALDRLVEATVAYAELYARFEG